VNDLSFSELQTQIIEPDLPSGVTDNMVDACGAMYEGGEVLGAGRAPAPLAGRQLTTWTLIAEIRRWAMKCPDSTKVAYAVTVFDHALIQLGGLAFAVSRNKIRDPEQAVGLAARVSNWINLVCPEFVTA
jgi:hypothetical protein